MEFKLKAEKRSNNEKLAADTIAAVVYGKGVNNESLKMKRIDFEKTFSAAGESNLISLDFGAGAVKVLVKDLQRDPLKNTYTHVDFYQVNMKEKITTEIPLHFIGESKAIKELGGMLMKEINELEVECLPSDLVDHIDIDISVLATYDDVIKIGDLVLPETFRLTHNHPSDVVVVVVEPKVQVEEEKPVEAAPAEAEAKDAKKEEAKK
ncbi:MAG: 50S ribosomal protein L25 [Patescibacteria group bacterium]